MASTEKSLPPLLAFASIVGFATVFTPLLIHYVTRKYIVDISYDPTKEEYTATVFNVIPIKSKVYIYIF